MQTQILTTKTYQILLIGTIKKINILMEKTEKVRKKMQLKNRKKAKKKG